MRYVKVEMTEELKKLLKVSAATRDVTQNDFIVQAIKRAIENT